MKPTHLFEPLQHFFGELKPLPSVPLGQWPTPVDRLDRLSARLNAEIWVKRDERSGSLYGGNKVRKLELLLGDALDRGCRSVVTVGGMGSNHVIATAIYARELGLKTLAVVFPQPVTPEVRHNIELATALGVELVPCAGRALVPFLLMHARRRASHPYVIAPGGSSPLGILGFVAAALELHQQIIGGQLPMPDDLFVPLGSGGTMAGLVLGFRLLGLQVRVIGVRVVERLIINTTVVRFLIRRTVALLRRLGAKPVLAEEHMMISHDQFGARYGKSTPAAEHAVRLADETEGLKLETTYTGKTMAVLIDHCRNAEGRRLLFWNTYNAQDTSSLLGNSD